MIKMGKQAINQVMTGTMLTFILVALVAVASFGLGRLSMMDRSHTVSLSEIPFTEGQPSLVMGGAFVASKKGSAYYFPWCSGAERINASNMVWFTSREDAEQAGYVPAKNCSGL